MERKKKEQQLHLIRDSLQRDTEAKKAMEYRERLQRLNEQEKME